MKRNLPTLSIVTPSYNQGCFIRQTIESVRSQSYPAKEYFVKDGGSDDETKSILMEYSNSLEFVSKTDNGQADAINKGLRETTGEIVAYINSDDYYLPDAFATVLHYFVDHPNVMWVVGDALIVDEKGREIQKFVKFYKTFFRSIPTSWILFVLNPYPQPSVFFRKEVFTEIGELDSSLHYTMDYDYWLRIQNRYGMPARLPQSLSAFRIHAKSKGGSAYIKQFKEELAVLRRYSQNPILIGLHALHNRCILLAYSILK